MQSFVSTKFDLLQTKIEKKVIFTKKWDTRFYHLSDDVFFVEIKS